MSMQPLDQQEGCLGGDQEWPGLIQQFHDQGQNQSYPSPQWQQQADYTQLFDEETQRPFNSSGLALSAQLSNRPSVDAIPSYTFPADPRMVSPAPSPRLLALTSAVQPQVATFDDSVGFPYVNMGQFRTFSDPLDHIELLENVFEPGEKYRTIDMNRGAEVDDEVPEEEASDTDYIPKRKIGRRATKSKSLRASKSSRGLSTFACKSCKMIFNDPVALQCHVDKEHTRAFTCVFNFAGCPSTFASKNEWKRHVATQHLNFYSWVCNLDACGKAHAESSSSPKKEIEGMSSKGVIFNRKDLFTQHVRRMHAPNRKRPDKQKSTWDDRIKELQKDCLQVNRQGPRVLKCPVADCPALFSGSKCWDDRMEHVAKHLEKVAETRGAASVQHQNDELLVKWAQNEGIIDRVDGVYKLIPMNTWREGLDEDAEAFCEESCASATPYFPALDLSAVAYSEQTVVTKHENLPMSRQRKWSTRTPDTHPP